MVIQLILIVFFRILSGVFDACMDLCKDYPTNKIQLYVDKHFHKIRNWFKYGNHESIWECLGYYQTWLSYRPGSILGWRADFWHWSKYMKEASDSLAICMALSLVFGWLAFLGLPLILFAEGYIFTRVYTYGKET